MVAELKCMYIYTGSSYKANVCKDLSTPGRWSLVTPCRPGNVYVATAVQSNNEGRGVSGDQDEPKLRLI